MTNRRTFFRALLASPLAFLVPRAAPAMDLAKMQAVASAITNAGFSADLSKNPDGSWKVWARSNVPDIPVASANALAIAQGVTAFVSDVLYQ